MKKTDAMKWINALRSGMYKQGKDELYDPATDSYCCLGVADNVFPERNLSGGSHLVLNNWEPLGLNNEAGSFHVWLGTAVPEVSEAVLAEESVSLADLNDNGYSFDEIADIIQIEYVEGL